MTDLAKVAPDHTRSTSAPDPRATLTLEVLDRLLGPSGQRDFAVRLWDGTERGPAPGRPARFTLVLNRPDALRRMLLPPARRTLGEAYIAGDFDIEGDMTAIFGLVRPIARNLSARKIARLALDLRKLRADAEPRARFSGPRLSGRLHSPERDEQAIRHHFDIGNDFYRLWLDERMVYSCSYFPTGAETLDHSQERKLDHICRKLRLTEGERFLDLGCGFGGLVIHAAERYGASALGITLSPEQGALAQRLIRERGLENRCRVEVMDYRDLSSDETFDKIAAIGMVEHVGEKRLPELLAKAWGLLEPGSLFLIQAICWPGTNRRWHRRLSRLPFRRRNFIHRYIFPDLDLLPLHILLKAAGRIGFETRDVENLREHYAITLGHWFERLNAEWDRAVEEVGEPAARAWRAYLAYSASGFETGEVTLFQTLFAKPGAGGAVEIPRTRADLYGAVTAEGHA